ncbi:MAG: DUF4382 domain-containing protein [Burkholderiaceae bacterium]|jgi:hypothetical protein|nr:DUF4382 domain-containing protein [Burkholderiaceae bacterium]
MSASNPRPARSAGRRHLLRLAAGSLIAAAGAGLVACGGSNDGSLPATPATGLVSVAVTDAPGADFAKVWITLREIRFHKLDFAHPDDRDWLRYPLAQPVTVDLAQLSNGNLADVFRNLELPVGTYRQIRLILVDDDAPLTASAQAAGLQYNDQVDYTDASGSARVAPLELGGVREGIGVFGSFTVTAGKTLRLVLDFDIDHDVLRFPDFIPGNGQSAFTLKPMLRYFDLDTSAAIVGRVDPAALASTANPNGAFNLVIKAEELAADGSRRVVARATTIRPDGSFTLFPLHVPANAASKNYDIVIRGRNMETNIIRGVPAVKGSTPANNPTAVATSPLPIAPAAEYTVSLTQSARPTGSWVNFFQTLPGANEVPYEVRFRHVNPFTGEFLPFPLSAGNLRVGDYVAGGNPTLAPVVAQQGTGGFAARAGALQYAPSSFVAVTPPSSGSNTPITLPALAVDSAVAVPGSIRFNVTTQTAGRYDRGQVVVARYGMVVDSQPIDVVLASNGGTVMLDNLPAGSAMLANPGAVYYAYARVWNSANPLLRPRVVPVLGLADLRTTDNATLNLQLP